MTVEYRAPRTGAELEDSFECANSAFNSVGDFFANIAREDPWFRMENTRCCFVGGRVASVVQIYERPMRIGPCLVRAACIGGVGTHPDFQRAGYGLGVLHDTTRYMQEDGYDLSLLSTGVRRHYAKAGWVVHPRRFYQAELPESFPDPPADVRVDRFDEARDLDDVRKVYDATNARRTGTFGRTEAYWRRRPRWRHQDPDGFLVARREGETVGYGVRQGGGLRELGVLPGEEDVLDAVVTALMEPLREETTGAVRAGIPEEFAPLLQRLGFVLRRTENPNLMVRLVNSASLLRKVTPLLEERVREAGLDSVRPTQLHTEMGSVTLQVDAGTVTVRENSEGTTVAASQEQAIGLVMGGTTIDDVVAANGLDLDNEIVDALRVMFPVDELHHWEWDSY